VPAQSGWCCFGHDALNQTAHRLDAQRQWNDIEQQQITIGVVAGQLVGLYGGTQGHHLIGVQVEQRWLPKKCLDGLANHWHAGGTTDQHHTFDVVFGQHCVTKGLAHRNHGSVGQGLRGVCNIR
jgi:hypothetical protein